MKQEIQEEMKFSLAQFMPKRIFDDSVGDRILQVKIDDDWVEVKEEVFRSWTGHRRINGEDFHGPVYTFGSTIDSIPFTGRRECGCSACQQNVEPIFKVN